MNRTIKSITAALAVAALTYVSVGAVEAGDCKTGHGVKAASTNFNQPAKVKIYTLSAQTKRTSKKPKK